jgi:ABC-type proline/glycine betaine transport system ATPase subunit
VLKIRDFKAYAEALSSVGLEINAVAGKYPNQFSGGELQRISVARGLIPCPKLIVADEEVLCFKPVDYDLGRNTLRQGPEAETGSANEVKLCANYRPTGGEDGSLF